MMLCVCLLVLVMSAGTALSDYPTLTQPEQVHLSYGADATEMVVTWVTMSECASTAEYGLHTLSMTAQGTMTNFTDGGDEKRVIYIHRATMTVKPGQRYVYHVGSALGWSELFFFRALQSGSDWSPRFGVYGDLGNYNARTLPRIQQETERGHFDAILHIGDFAYNFDTQNGRIGDAFMNQLQPIAAYVPYMTAVGNHEGAYNFSHYKNRFTMPGGSGDNMYYSFNVGPVHLIMWSSEHYMDFSYELIAQQYAWLEQDLQEANKPGNRAAQPWIIMMCHRPLYCSVNDDAEHCTNPVNPIRVGFPSRPSSNSPEELMYKYGVDLSIVGHEHAYERTWPVYNMTVCNGSYSDEPYTNPTAPVHIVTGSPGCQETPDGFLKDLPSFSAFQSSDYGYSHMTVYNSTHLYFEQISEDQHGQTIDNMMLIKDKHEAHTCAGR